MIASTRGRRRPGRSACRTWSCGSRGSRCRRSCSSDVPLSVVSPRTSRSGSRSGRRDAGLARWRSRRRPRNWLMDGFGRWLVRCCRSMSSSVSGPVSEAPATRRSERGRGSKQAPNIVEPVVRRTISTARSRSSPLRHRGRRCRRRRWRAVRACRASRARGRAGQLMMLPRTLVPSQSITAATNGTSTPGAANVTIVNERTSPVVAISASVNSVPKQPAQALRRSKYRAPQPMHSWAIRCGSPSSSTR